MVESLATLIMLKNEFLALSFETSYLNLNNSNNGNYYKLNIIYLKQFPEKFINIFTYNLTILWYYYIYLLSAKKCIIII